MADRLVVVRRVRSICAPSTYEPYAMTLCYPSDSSLFPDFQQVRDGVVGRLFLGDALGGRLLRCRRHMALQRDGLRRRVGVDVDVVRVEVVGVNQRRLDLHRLRGGVERRADRVSGVFGLLSSPVAGAFHGLTGFARFLLHFGVGFARFLLVAAAVFRSVSCSTPRAVF